MPRYLLFRCATALTGKVNEEGEFTGEGFVLLTMDGGKVKAFGAANAVAGALSGGTPVAVVGHGEDADGVLELATEPGAAGEEGGPWTFEPPPGVAGRLEDTVLMQSTWLKLRARDRREPFRSVFAAGESDLEALRDPTGVERGFQDGRQPTSCDGAARSVALRPGSLHEFALACAQGSGSKWVLSLLELSTGIQSYVDAVAGKKR